MPNLNRVVLAACLSLPVVAQTAFTQEKFSVSPFVGAAGNDEIEPGTGIDLKAAPAYGVRFGQDLWRRFGFEQTLSWNPTNLRFLSPVAGVTAPRMDARSFRFSFDGVYNLTDRGSRFRPFFAGGIGGSRFGLTDDGKRTIPTALRLPGTLADPDTLLQFNYGGGVKIRLTNLIGLRGDLRGLTSRTPGFGFSRVNNGGAFIPNDTRLNGAELTGGIVFNFGGAAAPQGPAARKISKDFTVVSVTQDPTAAGVESQGVLINTPVLYKAVVQNPKNRKLKYQWFVDGQPAGTDSDTFVYTPTRPGLYRVQVEVSEADKKNPAFAASPAAPSVYAKAPPPPPPPAPEHRVTISTNSVDPASAAIGVAGAQQGSLTGLTGANSVASGAPVRLSVQTTDTLGHNMTYNWLINGTQAGTGNPFTYTPAQPGWYRAEVRVVDAGGNGTNPPSPAAVTIYARDTRPPTATCSVSNANLTPGQSANLNVAATVAQGHTARIRWALSEGTVANATGAQTAFNSSTVNFPANPQVQVKSITATATVTDDGGATANCTTTIRVSTDPQAVHYGDILFGGGSARVDNAAKRVLLERVYPELTSAYQGYTLVLVGHIDPSERRVRNLDRNRVRNTAAVLTAAARSCAALELSRIKADWIGQEQTEYKDASGLADTRGSSINRNDPRAQNRRVELWLVPAGKPVPGVVKESHSFETRDLRGLGCPR